MDIKSCDPFLHFGGPSYIFGADEARDFKFDMEVERHEYFRMHVN